MTILFDKLVSSSIFIFISFLEIYVINIEKILMLANYYKYENKIILYLNVEHINKKAISFIQIRIKLGDSLIKEAANWGKG